MSNSGLRGTTSAQDTRFKDKESKAIKGTKFPIEFEKKVDVRKVNLAIMRPWIAKTVTELSGVEDDIVIEYTMELLEDPEKPRPDPKKMQISLVGFLSENAAELMSRLWKLLLSAQESPGGVPAEFIEAKKAELIAQREAEVKMQEKMMGRGSASGPGTRIHAGFPEDRGARQGPPSGQGGGTRFDRGQVPRDREGRAFPRGQGAEGYGGGGRRGGPDRYDYTQSGGGGGRDGGRREPPRRYFDDRERDRDRGYEGRRSRRMDDEASERDVRAMGMRRSSPPPLPPPPRRGRNRDDDRNDSRSRSRSRTPPRRRRSPSRSRSRSRSNSRSRSRSRTPPRRVVPTAKESDRRRRRSPSQSRSRTPPRVVRQRRRSPSPGPPARGGGGRRRSPSPATWRAPLPMGRDMSPDVDAHRRSRGGPTQGRAVDRSRSRSRSRSRTPVRRRRDSRTPPAARRAKSPDNRSRSRTPSGPSP